MSMRRRVGLAVMLIAVAVAVVLVVEVRSGGDELAMETADGVHFLRNRAGMENDAVAHSGRLFVGDDSCLYVQLDDDGSTHLAALRPGVTVTSGELDLGGRRLAIGTQVTFGRENVIDPVPSEALETCSDARTAYGVG